MNNPVLPKDVPFYLAKNEKFIEAKPEDDLLHPESFSNLTDSSATETQYFGFGVPEEQIHGFAYLWHHPNLKLVSGGLFVYQGIKSSPVFAELYDYDVYMDDSVLNNDLHEFRLTNGYGVKILEPLKRFHMTYSDPERNNAVDLIFNAASPIIMFSDGNHFEQSLKVTGEICLRGKRYNVDTYTIRDRSWGKSRQEMHVTKPPMSWAVGTFNENFSFNCNLFDQAKNDPSLTGEMALSDDEALQGGWVYKDGKIGCIVSANKQVKRAPTSLEALSIELDFKDEYGREFEVKGSLAASVGHAWNKAHVGLNLMNWESEGLTGTGDLQEVFWNDYLNR